MVARESARTLFERPRPVNSIFQESWWLDAVAPGQWGVVEVRSGGSLQAWMPYVLKHGPLGLVRCSMPSLTKTLGPWIDPGEGKYAQRLGTEMGLMEALIEQLPKFDYFNQNFHHSITNFLPFAHRGFKQQTGYTYLLPDLSDLDAVWDAMLSKRRQQIRKAEKRVEITTTEDVEEFLRLNRLTFARQGLPLPYDPTWVRRIDAACAAHGARRILVAHDEKGQAHAAVYIVHNELAAYYLMGGLDPEVRESSAFSLLMWEAIKFASTVSRVFDFEGSMMRQVEPVFRSFGAIQTPYLMIRKLSRRMRIAFSARDLSRALLRG